MADSTFRELMEHFKLAEKDYDKQVGDSHLECISRSHCEHWKRLPAHLGVDPIVAKDIDSGQGDEAAKRHNFFSTWKEKKGSGATYKQLITALLKVDCRQDAESVCEMLKDSVQPLSGAQPTFGKSAH